VAVSLKRKRELAPLDERAHRSREKAKDSAEILGCNSIIAALFLEEVSEFLNR
jgi:hypothetical protein